MTFSLNYYLFGPLDTEYCTYFYVLSVICFCTFVLTILSALYSIASGNKKMDLRLVLTMMFGSLLYAALYLQNRLLHSMCVSKEGYTAAEKKEVRDIAMGIQKITEKKDVRDLAMGLQKIGKKFM